MSVGLLVTSAVPASAVNATGVVLEASSTLTISGTITRHFGGHATTNICSPNSSAPTIFPVAFDSNGGGTIGPANAGDGDVTAGTNTFKVRMIVVGGDVTISTTGVVVNLTMRAEFRTCDSVTLLCMTNNVNITLAGPATVSHHPQVSERVTVSGTTASHITVPPTCNTIIRSVLVSHTATASLNLHAV